MCFSLLLINIVTKLLSPFTVYDTSSDVTNRDDMDILLTETTREICAVSPRVTITIDMVSTDCPYQLTRLLRFKMTIEGLDRSVSIYYRGERGFMVVHSLDVVEVYVTTLEELDTHLVNIFGHNIILHPLFGQEPEQDYNVVECLAPPNHPVLVRCISPPRHSEFSDSDSDTVLQRLDEALRNSAELYAMRELVPRLPVNRRIDFSDSDDSDGSDEALRNAVAELNNMREPEPRLPVNRRIDFSDNAVVEPFELGELEREEY
jgi:hypothetical protein